MMTKNSVYSVKFMFQMILLSLLIFGSVLMYTEDFSTIGQISRFVVLFMFCLFGARQVSIDRHLGVWTLLLLLNVLVLLLVVTGLYYFSPVEVIKYILFLDFCFLALSIVGNLFSDNLLGFLRIWQLSLFCVLTLLQVVYGGISLNFRSLWSAMILNDRYGNNVTVRIGMGFTNVNNLGMFAGLLLLVSIVLLFMSKNRLFSIINIPIALIYILNSGTRSVLIAVFAASTVIVLYKLPKPARRIGILIFGALGAFMVFIFLHELLFDRSNGTVFSAVDALSSRRLQYGVAGLQIAQQYGSLWLGLGPMSSSYNRMNLLSDGIQLDNSIEYYIFSIGFIGLLVVIAFVVWFAKQAMAQENWIGISVMVFYLAYSMFENVLLIPNAAVTSFCLPILFIASSRQKGGGNFVLDNKVQAK